jgi:hypothetical protein
VTVKHTLLYELYLLTLTYYLAKEKLEETKSRKSEAVNKIMTDNIMTERKETKGQNIIQKRKNLATRGP